MASSVIQERERQYMSILQFAFRNNIRHGLRTQQQRRRNQRFSYRKTFVVLWALLGVWSYGILGWMFLSISEESSVVTSGMQASGISSSPIPTVVSESKVQQVDGPSPEMVQDINQEENIVDSTTLGYIGALLKHLTKIIDQRGPQKSNGNLSPEGSFSPNSAVYGRTNVLQSRERSQHSNIYKLSHSSNQADKIKEWQRRAKMNDQAFGFVSLPVCLFCLIVSILRLWEECSGRNQRSALPSFRRLPFMRPRDDARSSAYSTINQERFSSVLINRDRLERGEPVVSLNSYLAFQRVLNDRSIWIGLAERLQHEDGMRGRTSDTPTTDAIRSISQQQLQHICPQWKYTTEDAMNKECCICLAGYELNDVMRTLPCRHVFHMDCIDRWMRQSSSCPMCKRCLALDRS
jgi:Ring finger domain